MSGRLQRLPALALPSGVRVAVATGRGPRALGLAGLRVPPPDAALLLPGCRSVHTVGMRWPLDLVWLGRDGTVIRVDRGVPPVRVRTCRAARAVIEVPAGEAGALVAALGGAWRGRAAQPQPRAIAAAPATTAAAPASRAGGTRSRPAR
jgi:uncharacterized membrane protein (UPF0127 family)